MRMRIQGNDCSLNPYLCMHRGVMIGHVIIDACGNTPLGALALVGSSLDFDELYMADISHGTWLNQHIFHDDLLVYIITSQ